MIGIHKIAAAWTDNDKHINAHSSSNGAYQAGAGRDPAFAERAAQLNALGASSGGSHRRLHRIDTNLKVHDD
jgi:hypothetical protein